MSKRNHLLMHLTPVLLLGLLGGCAEQQAKPEPVSNTLAQNDYPTLARVEFVMDCMQKKGAQNYNTMYSCVCSADKLAEKINFAEYSEAKTFANLGALTGDRGNAMRDAPQSRKLKKQLQEAQVYAHDACTVFKPE